MSKLARHLKNIEKRKKIALSYHVERLGAAFCKETGLDPTKVQLVVKDGKCWYEERSLDGLPETFRELVDIGTALVQALEQNNLEGVEACHKELRQYYEALETKT